MPSRARYAPSGPAPSTVIDAFNEGASVFFTAYLPTRDRTLLFLPAFERLPSMCGWLWNCSDSVPLSVCTLIGIPAGSAYARAARRLKKRLRECGLV